jgi:hypothetical protein
MSYRLSSLDSSITQYLPSTTAASFPSHQQVSHHVQTETSIGDMKAGFLPSPEPIQGIPTLQLLIELLFHLCCCAQTQRSPAYATMNLLFCTAPRDVYAFLSSEAYPDAFAPFPPEVPNVPNFTACFNNNDRATVRAMHARDKKTRVDIVRMNTTLANVFLKGMSSQLRTSLQQRHLRKPNIIFVDLFLWFVEQYGKTMAEDRKANRQCMATNWHPANGFSCPHPLPFHRHRLCQQRRLQDERR